MKRSSILAIVASAILFSSCADPYYGPTYGPAPYPANCAETVVPLVVGAAVVAALLSHDKGCAPPHSCHTSHHDGPPPRYGW
ncbi:MAG: hypothetical protein RI957_1248 [Verrucomicrobiota bacterium]|jgi:hypothetical protein